MFRSLHLAGKLELISASHSRNHEFEPFDGTEKRYSSGMDSFDCNLAAMASTKCHHKAAIAEFSVTTGQPPISQRKAADSKCSNVAFKSYPADTV